MFGSNEHPLKELISELLKEYQLADRLYEIKANQLWPQVVGKMITRHTKAVYYRNKKLFVTLDNAALKEELHYTKEKLIKLINKQAGESIVEEIFFK
jgi:predicted nucleic acid-binding Zn ribbon protein